ncbi:hypothetical protein [Amphritea sp.]|uniref:hypothetical protein n=1 Tax=Amphritea sp. TaxID=1872502 RepID=UPI0025BE46F6|nr:hypothetical protein [Amphritea sp.]
MLSKLRIALGMLLVAACFNASAAVVDISIASTEYGSAYGSLTAGQPSTILVELEEDTTATTWYFSFNPDNADAAGSVVPVVATVFTATIFDALNNLVATVGPTSDSPASTVLRGLIAGTYSVVLNSTENGGYTATVSAVPVPAAALLFGSALLGFAGFSARRKVS